MFNLMKMDLYRLVHSFSTKVMIFTVIAASVLMIVMTNVDIKLMKEGSDSTESSSFSDGFSDAMSKDGEADDDPVNLPYGLGGFGEQTSEEEEIPEEETTIMFGLYFQTNPDWADGDINLLEVMDILVRSGTLLIFCTIFATLFINAEQKNGYVKNIAGLFPKRTLPLLSKVIAVFVQTLSIFVLSLTAMSVCSLICWGDRVYIGSFAEFLPLLGLQLLLHFAFSCLISFFCTATRSSAFSIAMGMVFTLGLSILILQGAAKIISLIDKTADFNLYQYSLVANINSAYMGMADKDFLRAVIVALVFLVCSIGLSLFITKKRDIR